MKRRCVVCGQESAASFSTCSACLTPFIDTPISQVRTLRNKQESLKSNSRAIELEAALKDVTLISTLSQKEKTTVYLATTSTKENRVVRSSSYASREERERFLALAATLEQIQDHGVPKVYQYGTLPSGRVFMVSEYITGQSLRTYMKERQKISATKATAIGGQILMALEVAHKAGIIHQNLRPENIYLREVGGRKVVTLIGFGVTHELGAESPGYLSPEQAMGEPLDVRADLYSFGVLLFEVITGRLPFLANSAAELVAMQREELPPAPSALVEELPRRLDEVLLRCLEKHRDDRPASASTLREQLLNALHSAPSFQRNFPAVQLRAPRRSLSWMFAALAVGVLLLGFLLGLALDH